MGSQGASFAGPSLGSPMEPFAGLFVGSPEGSSTGCTIDDRFSLWRRTAVATPQGVGMLNAPKQLVLLVLGLIWSAEPKHFVLCVIASARLPAAPPTLDARCAEGSERLWSNVSGFGRRDANTE
jgi:hypothetical protein